MDVLVAGTVLGVSLVILVGLISKSMTSQLRSERLATAAMLLDETLSQVLVEDPENFKKFQSLEGRCESPYEMFSYEVDLVTPAEGEPYHVTATILWPEGDQMRRVSAQTLIAPRLGDEQPVDRLLEFTVER